MTNQSTKPWLTAASDYVGMIVVLAVLVCVFAGLSDHFFSLRTLTTIVNQIPSLALISIGMTFVLITKGIDLSVGSVMALSGATIGILMVNYDCPAIIAISAAVTAGCLCGAITGGISVLARIPSFIVSLGVLQVARGLTYYLTDSKTVYIGSAIEPLGARIPQLGVSPAFLLAISIVIACQFVLHRTVFGRYCIAVGFSEDVVRYSGIDPRWPRIKTFVLSGCFAGLAGAIDVSRLASADPNSANGIELSAIAAAVIGGTSLMGGRGSMINTLFGVLAIAILQTGLSQVGAQESAKRMITGGVIVFAVLLDAYRLQIKSVVWNLLPQSQSNHPDK